VQSVGDLLRKNLEAFGERDAEKRRAAISTIWDSDGVFVDPDGLHIGLEAIDKAIEHLLLKFPDFVFSELGVPDSHNGIGRLTWGFGLTGETPSVTGLDVIVSKTDRFRRSIHSSIPPRGEHNGCVEAEVAGAVTMRESVDTKRVEPIALMHSGDRYARQIPARPRAVLRTSASKNLVMAMS
jgi:hypothetical protein